MAEVQVPKQQICITILWPSFMVAIVATGVFFSAFDPYELYPFGDRNEISRLGSYTIGFLLFWLFSAISGMGTFYFAMTNCMRNTRESRDK